MEIDFNEGVELVVNLRYEHLFGFCHECCRMTHDHSRCPNLALPVEEGAGKESGPDQRDRGSLVTSYKAVVANGEDYGPIQREGYQGNARGTKESYKGKGIAKDKSGSFRQDGAYRAYKERFPQSYGEGSSRGRRFGNGAMAEENGRVAINPRGLENVRNGEEGQILNHPQKLLMDAFEGTNQAPKEMQESLEMPLVEIKESLGTGRKEELMDHDAPSALDEANLMLLDEEWEEGEVSAFLEDMENVGTDGTLEETTESTTATEVAGTDETCTKVSKRKGLKAGAFVGDTKRLIVQSILSPRKNKISKVPAKPIDKGNGDGKKGPNKPKDGGA
ncbi:unnamed protein product [Eruca vesicaria subsp. sativa]|uniref:Zinc knuckle CX2CX4HX4C domain-containing protein n=1 Tax=Eruca vesicaria subsp. sativa TaxID=29727 RepID=A0ABC8KMG9_ERUVS|nr:unnamed protein product [Eruca vesicaria subsp. sativa]